MCSKTPHERAGGFSNNLLVFLSMGKRGSYIMIFKLPSHMERAVFDMLPKPEPASKTTSPGFMRPRIPVSR